MESTLSFSVKISLSSFPIVSALYSEGTKSALMPYFSSLSAVPLPMQANLKPLICLISPNEKSSLKKISIPFAEVKAIYV